MYVHVMKACVEKLYIFKNKLEFKAKIMYYLKLWDMIMLLKLYPKDYFYIIFTRYTHQA